MLPRVPLVVLGFCAFLAGCSVIGLHQPGTYVLNSEVTPEEALSLLKAGNKRYRTEHRAFAEDASHRRATLAKGQKPFAVILGCADSRTAPEIIFDQQLGSLFVCRVAGNVTDPVVLGSIEYAVEHLHSPLIVVLGHSKCGAVTAALDPNGHPEGNIGRLLQKVHPGDDLPREADARLNAAVAHNAAFQARNLTAQSPVIGRLVQEGKVRVVGGVYSLDSGEVQWQ